MQKIFTTLFFSFLFIPYAFSVSPMQMRFHCANDTTEINALLKEGINSKIQDPSELVVFYANKLIGHPYVAHTLEADKELLTINIDQLDCTTFVETLYALTSTTLDNRYSWRDYAQKLENLRYRGGTITDYASRLHYISDWIVDNTARGNIKEVTGDIPGSKYTIKTIDFMSNHRDKYPALADSTQFAKVKNTEIGYRLHRFPYVKKEWLKSKETVAAFKSGDIIGIVTKIDGLDVSHLGIIIKENGVLYFIDASSIGKKVQREDETFFEYMRRNRSSLGIRVIRIMD